MNDRRMNQVRRGKLQSIVKAGLLLLMGAAMTACAATTWKEEVLLHDGSKIVVERSVDRGGRHEIGQSPPIREQGLTFSLPANGEGVSWKSEFTADIGYANLQPMLLDVFQGTAYIVSDTVGCLSYNKWGRPNPPYVVLKYQNKQWLRVPLEELPAVIKTPNMIFGSPDDAVERSGKRFMSVEMIAEIRERYRQPEYKTILREPLAPERQCRVEFSNGIGTWLSVDWFRDEKDLSACVRVCERKGFNEATCPCGQFFKGN